MDKEWVLLPRNTEEYRIGASKFIDMAKKNSGDSDIIVCPCRDCENLRHKHCDVVFDHLVMRGMDRTYTTWVLHGEHQSASVQCDDVEMLESYQMYKDVHFQYDNVVEPTHEGQEGQGVEFANLVEDAETPLYSGCKKYTKMSATITLFKHKATNGLSEKSFNELLEIIRDMLPQDNTLPDSLYSMKKFLKTFDLGYEKIHACANDCCLFRKEFEHMDSCPKCGSSRWKVDQRTEKVHYGVPAKVLRYFPISSSVSNTLKWLARGPREELMSYSGYIINGIRFHTKDAEKSTQNSGVSIKAETMCRSSARDNTQVIGKISYYGIIRDIILLDYNTFRVPIFRCDWANIVNGVKVEDGFTLVNLHEGLSQFEKDPFILASHAEQVFYSRDSDTSSWYVVLRAPPRGFHELEMYDETTCMPFAPVDVSRLDIDADVENESYVRMDCEGLLV